MVTSIPKRSLSIIHTYKGKLVIIKDVPVGGCQECGQRYYNADTFEKLDTTAQNSDAAQERITVPVMAMTP